uniref:hypothetical protein n=1 Tax=Hafnia alvei TaxID=569 RepID=UPI00243071BF|nr:hypothetical protein [Hafnia alvei]
MNNLPIQTYESVVQQRDELEKKLADMAAENTKMRNAIEFATAPDMWIEQHDGMLEYRYVDWYVDVLNEAKETPATDAFMAEVRAQVWIEGNEPAEFGRYWVRYETDVGPQYCSAKWMEHNFCAGSDTNIHKIWLSDHSRSINSLKGVTHYTMLPEPIEGGAK